jgi:hypothetical protein
MRAIIFERETLGVGAGVLSRSEKREPLTAAQKTIFTFLSR